MLTVAQVLAQNNFGDTRTGGLAGPMGLFMIVVLAIATVLLIRNMNARLRRLPDRFPDQGADGQERADSVATGTVEATTTAVDATPVEESRGSVPNMPHLDRNKHSAP